MLSLAMLLSCWREYNNVDYLLHFLTFSAGKNVDYLLHFFPFLNRIVHIFNHIGYDQGTYAATHLDLGPLKVTRGFTASPAAEWLPAPRCLIRKNRGREYTEKLHNVLSSSASGRENESTLKKWTIYREYTH